MVLNIFAILSLGFDLSGASDFAVTEPSTDGEADHRLCSRSLARGIPFPVDI